MALAELAVFLLVGEQRCEAHDLGTLHVAEAVQAVDDVVELLDRDGLAARTGDSAPARDEQVRVLGHDDVLVVQLQRLVEALAQLGKVLQRAAEEGDVATDGPAARQARDGLRDDRLEDGRGDVLLARALVEQRLHVGFREHAAAARDGIDGGVAGSQLVQATRVGVEQRGHLVDEGTRAAGARAVHALLDGLAEVDDLGILAAELDGDIGLRDVGFHGGLARDDLLDELDAEPFGEQQAAAAGDRDGHELVAVFLRSSAQHLGHRGAHVRMMALVDGPQHLVLLVEDGKLHGRGAHIDADAQRTFALHGIPDALRRGIARAFALHGDLDVGLAVLLQR